MVIQMQKKFKEYRMFIACFILFIIFIVYASLSFIQKNTMHTIGALLLSSIALLLLLTRYQNILFDDMMIIYEWKVIAMLPVVIEYKDIQSIKKHSKHHIVVHHKRKSHIYVFNSDLFLQTYEDIRKVK